MKDVKAIVEQATNPLWVEPSASVEFNVDSNLEFLGIYDDDPLYPELFEKSVARLTELGICDIV